MTSCSLRGRCGQPSAGLWSTLALVGLAGFGAAIGAHPAVGYEDAVHLAPAVLGAATYSLGLILSFKPMVLDARSLAREPPGEPTELRGILTRFCLVG